MIGIRGAGASLPITDATATASDIVSGKIAYNNNGRIVGTHIESGTVITDATATSSDIKYGKIAYNNSGRIVGTHIESTITDATANASDVISGKVFYNNNGRQVGTLSQLTGPTQHISIPSGTLSGFTTNQYIFSAKCVYKGNDVTMNTSTEYVNTIVPVTSSTKTSIYKITTFNFDLSKLIHMTVVVNSSTYKYEFPSMMADGWCEIPIKGSLAFLISNNKITDLAIVYSYQTTPNDKLKYSYEIDIEQMLSNT